MGFDGVPALGPCAVDFEDGAMVIGMPQNCRMDARSLLSRTVMSLLLYSLLSCVRVSIPTLCLPSCLLLLLSK